jgi:hypothetical protein
MAHKRQEIREKFRDTLKGASKTAAGENVFTSRIISYFPSKLPSISIYTVSESSEKNDEAPRKLRRELQISIEIVHQLVDDVDDALDAIAEDVEKLIRIEFFITDPFFSLEYLQDQVLTGTDFSIRDDGDNEVGSLVLKYTALYFSDEPEAGDEGTLDDFAQANVDWEQPPADVDTDAQDQIDFP